MSASEVFPEPPAAFPVSPLITSSIPGLHDEAGVSLSLSIAETPTALEELRPYWSRWARSLETDLDYFLHRVQTDPSILRPWVAVVSQDGAPRALLAGYVRRRRLSSVVSFVRVPGPMVTALEVVEVLEVTEGESACGRPPAAYDARFARELSRLLRAREVDLVSFQRLPLRSPLFQALEKIPGFGIRRRLVHSYHYSVVSLAASAGRSAAALAGKNRREARRKTRILERAFPGRMRFRCFSRPADLDRGLRDAASVDACCWQHYLGSGLLDEPAFHETLAFCAERGWLRVFVLYVDELPVAFLVGQHYGQTFYCQHAGYRPDFARYSVGSLLTSQAFKELEAAGVLTVDLGEGGQEHNRRLGCALHRAGTVHFYAPSWRGVCGNGFIAACQMLRWLGRWARERLRLQRAADVWGRFILERWTTRQEASVWPDERAAA